MKSPEFFEGLFRPTTLQEAGGNLAEFWDLERCRLLILKVLDNNFNPDKSSPESAIVESTKIKKGGVSSISWTEERDGKLRFFDFVFPTGVLVPISKIEKWQDFLRVVPESNFRRDAKGKLVVPFNGRKWTIPYCRLPEDLEEKT